jgi:hypothetical protein
VYSLCEQGRKLLEEEGASRPGANNEL